MVKVALRLSKTWVTLGVVSLLQPDVTGFQQMICEDDDRKGRIGKRLDGVQAAGGIEAVS